MTTGQWVAGRSNLAIAELHGVSPDTVKGWATSASRIIRFAIEGDVEDIRATMLATLGTVVREAMSYQKVFGGKDGETDVVSQPDLKSAISAIELQAKLQGMLVQKHEVTMTEAEAEALVAKAAGLAK